MPQPHGYLFQSAAQPLSIDTILRPISLSVGDSFRDYFAGADVTSIAIGAGTGWETQRVSPVLAQQFDQDILGDMVSVWQNFVASGQIWALLFGIVLGYMIRNLTAY